MRFAFLSADDRAARAADDATAEAAQLTTEPSAGDQLAEPLTAEPTRDAAEALALYAEYLSELDNVPTLRDPVLPEGSGQHVNLDEKIREIVREELAKLQPAAQAPKRGSRKRRKR